MKPIYVLLIVVGMLLGGSICHNYYVKIVPDVQRDTTYIYEKVPYSRLDLGKMAVKLSVPECSVPNMVYIREDATTIIYRDSVRYVTLPREYYYTSVKDVEIWYSGVDPQIDSVNVFGVSKVITHTINNVSKNKIGIGIEASYYGRLSCPVYFEYERVFKPWLSCYFRVGHDIISRGNGAVAGMKMNIGF